MIVPTAIDSWLFQHRCLDSVSEQSTGSATF